MQEDDRAGANLLRAELQALQNRELARRAREAGADSDAVFDAQDSDSPKDALIELIVHHEVGPVSVFDAGQAPPFSKVEYVSSVDQTEGTGMFATTYTLYEFRIFSRDGLSWRVTKRFSDFASLKAELVESGAQGASNLPLPEKRFRMPGWRDDAKTVRERKDGLVMFMTVLMQMYASRPEVDRFVGASEHAATQRAAGSTLPVASGGAPEEGVPPIGEARRQTATEPEPETVGTHPSVPSGLAPAFAHLDPQGAVHPYTDADNALIADARARGLDAVRINDVVLKDGTTLRFEVRFGHNAGSTRTSSAWPTGSPTGLAQVNLDNQNTRRVVQLDEHKRTELGIAARSSVDEPWETTEARLLATNEWSQPGAEYDDGDQLVGCTVYVCGHGEGRVQSFEKTRVGASTHTIQFGVQTQGVKLRRKRNSATRWLVSRADKEVSVERWKAAELEKFRQSRGRAETEKLRQAANADAVTQRKVLEHAQATGIVSKSDLAKAQRKLDEREDKERAALETLERDFEEALYAAEMQQAYERAQATGLISQGVLESRAAQVHERVAKEAEACRALESQMQNTCTVAQIAAAIDAADAAALVDPAALQRARGRLEARQRQQKQRVLDFKKRIDTCTTSEQVQNCIAQLDASGIDDEQLRKRAQLTLLSKQRDEQKELKRQAAAEQARQDLEMFMGHSSGMQCPGCSSHKLHREFLQCPLTPRCSHLQQQCMRCLKRCLDGKKECPDSECRAKVEQADIQELANRLALAA